MKDDIIDGIHKGGDPIQCQEDCAASYYDAHHICAAFKSNSTTCILMFQEYWSECDVIAADIVSSF